MTSLNHIPEHLRDHRFDDDRWTPRRALARGTMWTASAVFEPLLKLLSSR